MQSPIALLKVAINQVPAVKYAIGVTGVAAAVSIVLGLGVGSEKSVIGVVAMFGGMFVLLVFVGAAKLSPRAMLPQVLVLLWTFTILCAVWSILLTTSYFFEWPIARARPLPSPVTDQLDVTARHWKETSEKAKNAGSLNPSRPLPPQVVDARSRFETAWTAAADASRRRLPPDLAYAALSHTIKAYRVQEKDSVTKPSAFKWAEEAITFFEGLDNRKFLTESLMDKGAIFLEASQIEHNDPGGWERLAQGGDGVMSRACALAEDGQRADCLRIWSRFLYNLSRPRDGNLAKNWDGAYLGASYEKMKQAFEFRPDLGNAIQLARITQKTAANPPNDEDDAWTGRLEDARAKLEKYWSTEGKARGTAEDRIPALNIRGVIALDVVERTWRLKKASADTAGLIQLLESIAIPSQHECITLLPNTEWQEDYGFDMRYDLARMYAVSCQIQSATRSAPAAVCLQVAVELENAKGVATQRQWGASTLAFKTEPHFARLPEATRASLAALVE